MSARIDQLRARIEREIAPTSLEIFDESHRHVGHAGAADGRGHFRLRVVAECFRDLGSLARHRRIYAAVGDLMDTDIHALSIEALSPEESA